MIIDKRNIYRLVSILLVLLCLSVFSIPAQASPEFSAQTSQACGACHKDAKGGGPLNLQGERFKASGYFWEGETKPDLGGQLLRLLLGFIHVLAAVVWFGSIVYIHVIIKPATLAGGMPAAEKLLGRICIVTVGLTGIGLTLLKLDAARELWTTTFGIILTIKVAIYLIMLAVAAVATTYIDRKLRETAKAGDAPAPDGKEGRPAHVFFEGHAYDVSQSKLWKDGTHMSRHFAGTDLTDAIEAAPHGPDILGRVPDLGAADSERNEGPPRVLKVFVGLAYFILVCVFLVVLCVSWWNWGPPLIDAFPAWSQARAQACVSCHHNQTHAVVVDWSKSAHARNKVSCLHCHQASPSAPDVSTTHAAYGGCAISARVSPKHCGLCHLNRVEEFNRSKHAQTIAILKAQDPWVKSGLVSDVEMVTGCEGCHGAGLSKGLDGLTTANYVSRGIGRINPDGSRGNCAACHGRHTFAASQARRAEACGVCHVGPEHPQMEIFAESKHGAVYLTSGNSFNWQGPGSTWTAGLDYRTPTCAACHMSAAGKSPPSHDVGRRLSWEMQASPTIRPKGADWIKARASMQEVCLQCHAKGWVEAHFFGLDKAVDEYNRLYHQPLAKMLKGLYAKGLLDSKVLVDEPLEIAFDEMGRREGRSAKMGAAMMAPDYAWWHGFYELKKSFAQISYQALQLAKRDR